MFAVSKNISKQIYFMGTWKQIILASLLSDIYKHIQMHSCYCRHQYEQVRFTYCPFIFVSQFQFV